MDIFVLVLLIIGGAFTLIGGAIAGVFAAVGLGPYALIPGLFIVIGLIMLISVFSVIIKKKQVKAKGTKYEAKIYSYVENKSYIVNGDYTMNAKVHYFDKTGIEREAIIPTSFAKGSNEYPIGMTIDIFEYNGKFDFDKNSIRSERIYREAELMDDKPIDRADIKMIAISCKNCGSSYEAIQGYTARCPYCGGYTNA